MMEGDGGHSCVRRVSAEVKPCLLLKYIVN